MPPEYDTNEPYPHSDANYTCPGPGIKCVCWDMSEQLAESQMDEADARDDEWEALQHFYAHGGES